MARNKKNLEYSPGLVVNVLRTSLASPEVVKSVLEFFKTELTITDTYGNGLMAYTGKATPDKSVFVGTNTKLGLSVAVFNGSQGMALFEKFRNDYLNVAKNADKVAKITASSLDATFVSYKPSDVRVADDLQNRLEDIISKQVKSIPKLDLHKGALYIGGRTGNTSLSISGSVQGDLSVKYVVTQLKLKDKSAQQFFDTLKTSLDSTTNAVIAYSMLEQLKRTSLTELTTDIRNRLVKEYDLAKVATVAQSKKRSTTSSGKFVLRALSGVTNKLRRSETRDEAGSLLVEWFKGLSTNNTKYSSKPALLIKDVEALLKAVKDSLPGGSSGSVRSLDLARDPTPTPARVAEADASGGATAKGAGADASGGAPAPRKPTPKSSAKAAKAAQAEAEKAKADADKAKADAAKAKADAEQAQAEAEQAAD